MIGIYILVFTLHYQTCLYLNSNLSMALLSNLLCVSLLNYELLIHSARV